MKKSALTVILIYITLSSLHSQDRQFTHQDTLRGSITAEREWWDLNYYHLDIAVDPEARLIEGSNTIFYTVLKPGKVMQIDLQEPLNLLSAEQNGRALKMTREGNLYHIELAEKQRQGKRYSITVTYEGSPREAVRAPWEGGITWRKDRKGNFYIASACQGDGASLWWPCKDHMYDEPDSMLISVTVPTGLVEVSNGRLRESNINDNNTTTYHWFVSNPISNYCVNLSIGKYTHFHEDYMGEKGKLDCDYWVLEYDLEKAVNHFSQAKKMLEAFEYWFGPYPFYGDSYKLVQVPYLGMEHQSCVTYGNGFRNGYMGMDLSGTGWGKEFDYIIVHESGHEWFANSITYRDIADMWVHESFTSYSECLYIEYFYGRDAGYDYVRGTRRNILNDIPVVGKYDVNSAGSGDMYYKGSNMLHTLRQIVNDDIKWRSLLRSMNEDFYHQTVSGSEIEEYLAQKTGLDLSAFFDQYLRDIRIPVLEYKTDKNNISFRWTNCIDGFNMPVRVFVNDQEIFIYPLTDWQSLSFKVPVSSFVTDNNFYINASEI